MSSPMTRRTLLGAGAAALLVAACGGGSDADDEAAMTTTTAATGSTTGAPSPTTLTAADFEALGTCSLLPESTAGPFPLDEQFDRRDITEGYPGHPTRLGLRVVDEACAPVPGATVEVWHADASGDYSAFADGGNGKDEGPGTTFLRGSQTASDDGIVEFATIYPGWYQGRTVHIHVRVHVDGDVVRTGQLYFDETHTAAVYDEEPYAEFDEPDTTNETDGIEGALLHLTRQGDATLALLNLGVPV